MAASAVGISSSALAMGFLFLYFRYEFSRASARGEHFDADEQILKRISRFEMDAGIRPWHSALPLVLIIVLINGFGLNLSYAVLAGTALAMLIGRKNLPDKLRTINQGIQMVGPAMVTTVASVGFGGAVLACPGAQVILNVIALLPLNSIISLSVAASLQAQ